MAKFAVVATVVCDDVRKEVTGKDLLIGVYGSSIVVPSFPVPITMAVWIELIPEHAGHLEIDLKINLPGNAQEFRLRYVMEIIHPGTPVVINTPQMVGAISEAGDIRVSIKAADENDWALIKSKPVLSGPAPVAEAPRFVFGELPEAPSATASVPTASPPPSGQSPAAAPASAHQPAPSRRRGRRSARTPAPE